MLTTLKLPGYTISSSVFSELPKFSGYGINIAVIGGKIALEKTTAQLREALSEFNATFHWYGGECSYENISSLTDTLRNLHTDWILGVGGGKSIDTAKVVAFNLNLPIITIPTIASTCAATTAISIIYSSKHEFERVERLGKTPEHILIPEDIIAQSPYKFLWAGIGDSIAKPIEVVFSGKNDVWTHENMLARKISECCLDPIIDMGRKALKSIARNEISFELREIVLNIIVSTGYVSVLVNPNYNSAIAHSLFYGLTQVEEVELNHLHGEIVAYGVLVQCIIDNDYNLLEKLWDFYTSINLPVNLGALSCTISHPKYDLVLEKTINGPELEYTPYKITREMLHDAIIQLDSYTANRKEGKHVIQT